MDLKHRRASGRREEKMGCCSARCMLILLCCVQLITALERQVFDFLGYQWAPIMINFFHIIMVILGLFGVIEYRTRYVVMYLLWTMLWVGWNVFVSCLYLDLGGLSKDSDMLTLGVSSHRSWWRDNGPGCERQGLPSSGWQNHQNPELSIVLSCWLEYQYIEILHCIIQLLVSLLSFVYACYIVSTSSAEEESFNFIGEFHHPSKPSQLFF
ncbi:sodium/potassium-transporting ATPase subunit beta-1-interacting protein 3 [Notolabrus celidotus]|uniref:sodium/potassium-transporting ATPase subunit beta-1-interacting protein 3 n=1 Tax=Notolabrus celidotus TaxID=1203425 RepID=UPI0014903947|nr:sodium/potassium-transporting ATPase subunit beta-1-interacting protein 3 [Notolabrus celidotus]